MRDTIARYRAGETLSAEDIDQLIAYYTQIQELTTYDIKNYYLIHREVTQELSVLNNYKKK